MSVRFRVLGPVGVWVDGEDVTPSGRLPRLLLAALLARAEGLTSTDLCQLLWGDPDRDARLHLFVHRTRAALDHPERLERTPDGYRLRTDPGELDLDDLADLALRDPAPPLTTARLEPFDGCDGELFDTRRSELAERLAVARKAALDAGDDGSRALRDHTGPRRGALRRGARPRPSQRPLPHRPDGRRPRRVRTHAPDARGRTRHRSRRRAPTASPTADLRLRQRPRATAAPTPPRRPHRPDGRLAALDKLGNGQPHIALITGTAGVGKTALALTWAARSLDRFPDGVSTDLGDFSPARPPHTRPPFLKASCARSVSRCTPAASPNSSFCPSAAGG